MSETPEQRLAALGLELPPVTAPCGNFRPYVISGPMLYLSGKGAPPRDGDGPVPTVERGEHSRSAIGVGSLPRGFAVEIEAVVEFS